MTNQTIELPKLTTEQKWKTAESNLIYFVVSGIAYAKSRGASPEDFGIFAGKVAVPSWREDARKGSQSLVAGISQNKQQFSDFQLEILHVSETTIQARMKGYGESNVRVRPHHEITVDEYIRFLGRSGKSSPTLWAWNTSNELKETGQSLLSHKSNRQLGNVGKTRLFHTIKRRARRTQAPVV